MLKIRQYESSDVDVVWQLHHLALDQVGTNLGPGPWDDDLHDISGAYLNAGGEFLVGIIGGAGIVAMGAFRQTSPLRAEIKRMRVHPNFQRRGFAQQILDALEIAAKQLGYAALHLDTTSKQTAAQSLYRKNGYVEVDRKSWRDAEMIFMEKSL